MQKPDYIKNTSGEGVADDILGCFYDNIAYTPFIHVEDDPESKERLLAPKTRKSIFKVPSSDQLRKSSKDPVDPYNLIIDNKLDTLRPSLKEVMDLEDTYSFLGSTDRFNMALLHQSFSKSGILQIVSTRSRPDAFLTQATISNPNEAHPGVVDIRVAKVGLLWRKDPRKKKTRSPWQEWGVILTNASLYFFRDINWIKSLITQFDYHNKQGNTDHPCTFKPPLPLQDFKPDTLMSTEDAVALQDSSYTKHKHAFQFIRHGKLEEVFLANTELDKNDWLAHLNYAATFRSAGVRMRGHVGFNYETQRDKGLNRMDSSHSSRSVATPTGEVSLQNRKVDHQLAHEILAARRQVLTDRISEANEKLGTLQKQLENQLRNARHLQILAPLQGRTREQIVLAAGRMSARVKWARMDIWRTKCHKEILSLDLDDEARHLQMHKLKDLPPTATSPRTVPSLSQPSLMRYDSKSSGPAPTSPKSGRSTQMQGPRPTTQSSTEKASVGDSLSPTNSIASQRPKSGQQLQGAQDTPLISAEAFEAISDGSFSVGPSRQPSHALLHQISVTSGHSKSDQSTSAQVGSRLATPTTSIIDGGEEKLLREAGLVSAESTPFAKRIETPKDTDKERARPMSPTSPSSPDFNSSDSRAKVRRSLHRTLRDSHHGAHHTRSRKGRDSASTVGGVDDASVSTEPEGLTRASGSFVVHGKKASVITFGSEWQTMSPEERLKLRKQAHNEDGKLLEQATLEDTDDSFVDARTGSIRSTSTTTAKSALSRRASEAELEPVNVPEMRGAGEQAVGEKTNGVEEREAEKEKARAGVEWTDYESEQIDEKGEFRRHPPIEQDVSA
jgi:PH domain